MNVINPNFSPKSEFKSEWIEKGINEKGIDYLENFGFFLCNKKSIDDKFTGYDAVTVSQIRNIFGEVKRIVANAEGEENEDWKTDFLLLRPKIAYNAARVLSKSFKSKIKEFREVLEMAHKEVKGDVKKLRNFSNFLEGIVAYHKVYGGKE
jgi:CRISPR-associated protein Csm2